MHVRCVFIEPDCFPLFSCQGTDRVLRALLFFRSLPYRSSSIAYRPGFVKRFSAEFSKLVGAACQLLSRSTPPDFLGGEAQGSG